MKNKKLLTQKLAQKIDSLISKISVLKQSKKPCDRITLILKEFTLNRVKKDYLDIKLTKDNELVLSVHDKYF
tara:strand:+ start:1238 stop:1453 length:216 start_codon:yes stop_codon:yes gene_type:complete